jgi:hypothetical protein
MSLLVTTNECRPLAFFDLQAVLQQASHASLQGEMEGVEVSTFPSSIYEEGPQRSAARSKLSMIAPESL